MAQSDVERTEMNPVGDWAARAARALAATNAPKTDAPPHACA